MTHAIEGYVSTDWSPHQDARSLHALRMIRDNLERAVERGEEDEEARGNMLIAANLAMTIALGSAHAMSHPAGAQFGVPHGVANAIHLPHVIRHNAQGSPDIADRYRDIGEVFDVADLARADADFVEFRVVVGAGLVVVCDLLGESFVLESPEIVRRERLDPLVPEVASRRHLGRRRSISRSASHRS